MLRGRMWSPLRWLDENENRQNHSVSPALEVEIQPQSSVELTLQDVCLPRSGIMAAQVPGRGNRIRAVGARHNISYAKPREEGKRCSRRDASIQAPTTEPGQMRTRNMESWSQAICILSIARDWLLAIFMDISGVYCFQSHSSPD
ncbi:hypothetical protein ACLKA6_015970 [Drosophila palustris]